jgi:hypothetical protein
MTAVTDRTPLVLERILESARQLADLTTISGNPSSVELRSDPHTDLDHVVPEAGSAGTAYHSRLSIAQTFKWEDRTGEQVKPSSERLRVA